MGRYDTPLPAILEPEGTRCVPLFVPDDPDYITMIVEHIRKLTNDRRYERGNPEGIQTVRDVWTNRTFVPFLDSVINGTPCEGNAGLGSCFRMDTATEAFSYYPNEPFLEEDYPPILSQLKLQRWADITPSDLPVIGDFIANTLNGVSGYFPNDVFVTFQALNPFDSPIERLGDIISQVTSFPFPYVVIEVEGTGQLEVELVQAPLGCRALLIPDLDLSLEGLANTIIDFVDNDGSLPSLATLVELERDIAGLELVATQIQEFEFTEEGTHTLHVVFFPALTVSPPFIKPFGGIREIEFCGDITVIGSQTGKQFTRLNSRIDSERDGVLPMTTQQDFYDALIRWTDERSKRWLLGFDSANFRNDVTLDKDADTVTDSGIKTLQSTFSANATPPAGSTSEQQRYGQAWFVGEGFRDLVNDTIGWYDDVGIGIIGAVERMLRLFQFSEDASDFTDYTLTSLYTAINPLIGNATDTVTPVPNVGAIADIVYCKGANKTSLYEYTYDLESGGGTDAVDIAKFYRAIIDNLTQSQIDTWYANGAGTPREGYQSAPCYRYPTITYDWLPSSISLHSSNLYAMNTPELVANRRYFVTVTGTMTDGTSVWDGLWLNPDGSASYVPFRIGSGSETNNYVIPDIQPNVSQNGYAITLTTNSSPSRFGVKNYTPIQNMNTGNLSFTFKDIGEA